jgi:hypothetical protein
MAEILKGLSPRQQQWFAAVRAGIEKDTGRPLEAWGALVRETCPETAPKKRLQWMRDTHGFAQNRAMAILAEAFGDAGEDDPASLAQALWRTPEQVAIVEAVSTLVAAWPEVVVGQRKAYTAFSWRFQFAALAPIKTTGARLGLALKADAHPLLEPPRKREPWSERLRAALVLESVAAVTAEVSGLLRRAYEAS